MYIALSSGHISLNFIMPFKLILMRFDVVFWCLGSENAALFERLMEFHSNPPILYYGFKAVFIIFPKLETRFHTHYQNA